MSELWQLSAKELADGIRAKSFSAVEATQSSLERLDAVNASLNAVVKQMPDEALEAAADIDAQVGAGTDPGVLGGVPITIKVNCDQRGHANTNGLTLQKDNICDEDSAVVANIRKSGGVIIGRTNTPAFSCRWFTRNGVHGHTRNPHNPEITPGGSSGGAASAVAAGIGAIAHGSDIAGSIRYPAYACGVHGIRPTVGRVPAFNPSAPVRHIGGQITSVQGPLARRVDDLEIALAGMSLRDHRDPWWAPAAHDSGDFPRRVALNITPDELEVDEKVRGAVVDAAKRLEDAGWQVSEVELPPLRQASELQILLWMSEARRIGMELVHKEADPDSSFVFDQFERNNPAPDADGYLDLLHSRGHLVTRWMEFLEQYPIVLMPACGELPFTDNADVESPERFAGIVEAQMPQIGIPFMGVPAMTVTTSVTGRMPVGVQLVAGRFREDVLFKAARDIENRGDAIMPVTPDF